MQKNYYAIIPASVRYDKDLPANAKLLYGEITALCNEKGYCWAGNSYFSDLYKVTNRTISGWINSLEQKGYIHRDIIRSDNKQVEKRIITITEGKKIQEGIEDNFLPYRKKLPEGIEENFRKNNTSINNTKNTAYSPEFETFWSKYPRKVDKKQAYTKFKTCIKKHSIEMILSGTEKYAKQVLQIDKKFIKHPSTFLHNESYIDGFEETTTEPVAQPPIRKEKESVLSGIWGNNR